ncbi:hypothetical protein U1Q18_037780 [Sarracenia purpurea var. burkii]
MKGRSSKSFSNETGIIKLIFDGVYELKVCYFHWWSLSFPAYQVVSQLTPSQEFNLCTHASCNSRIFFIYYFFCGFLWSARRATFDLVVHVIILLGYLVIVCEIAAYPILVDSWCICCSVMISLELYITAHGFDCLVESRYCCCTNGYWAMVSTHLS